MPRREQIGFAVFSTWTVIGLFLDGWAHRHDKPETFFSPYHGILYSGVAAGVLWSIYESRRSGTPVFGGSGLTRLGLALFGAGGVADFAWHEVFGIEADTEALLSPSHMLLFVGGLLLVTGPIRAAWKSDDDDVGLAPFVGVVLATAIVAFFTQFLHPFLADDLEAGESADYWIAGLLVATVVLVAPLLLVRARWRLPAGACTLFFVGITALVLGLEDFDRAEVLMAALAAGVVGDLVERTPRLFGAVVPVVLWLGFFVVTAVVDELRWTVELWLGSTVVAALGGYGLSLLAFPPER